MSDEDYRPSGDATLVVSVSGGKDSTAMALHMMELGLTFTPVFYDTGWEHPRTLEYVDSLESVVGPIVRLRLDVDLSDELLEFAEEVERMIDVDYSAMVRVILRKGMFPSRVRRFCTQELKIRPFRGYCQRLIADGHQVVNAVGVRAAESPARAKLPPVEISADLDCLIWRPLLRWTMDDVVGIHRRHHVRPNPLYLDLSTSRVGCWPCIYARKSEIRTIADTDDARIGALRRLEAIVGDLSAARMRPRVEVVDDPADATKTKTRIPVQRASVLSRPCETCGAMPGVPCAGEPGGFHEARLMARMRPTFFGSRRGGPLWRQVGPCPPVDAVVDWARVSRTGQAELFGAHETERGCLRWGLCDVGSGPASDGGA